MRASKRAPRTVLSSILAWPAQVCTRLQLPDVKKLRDALELTYDELAFSSIQQVSRPTTHMLAACLTHTPDSELHACTCGRQRPLWL